MSGLVRNSVFYLLVTFVLCFASDQCFGQEPAWWTKQKKDCGLPSNLAYNSWDGSCPAQSQNTGGTTDNGEAERQRQQRIEEERQRQEAEQKRLEAAKEAKRIADQKVFEKSRDEAAGTLKGSSGSSTVKTDADDGLKGSRTDDGPKAGMPDTKSELRESEYFYTLQTRKFEPLNDGGHPIDSPEAKLQLGYHGIVGGTSWTFGFKRPPKNCSETCRKRFKADLQEQLELYCSNLGGKKPAQEARRLQCIKDGLPFMADDYDFAVSMASSHSFFDDLFSRVLFDSASLGKFTQEHKEVFANLTGRQFDTLDCHSNGAMICLAALESPDVKTTAKVVRLFGPQITPEAAEHWKKLAKKGVKIEIYINNGDPVPSLAWQQPVPKTAIPKALTTVWFANPVTGTATLAKALFNTYLDSKNQHMDATLRSYGFNVTRLPCLDSTNLNCHSMQAYESKMK